jgi:hypothetical protein
MCPVCITTMALVVAGSTSTGGLTALVVKKLHAKKTRSNEGKDGKPENRVAS